MLDLLVRFPLKSLSAAAGQTRISSRLSFVELAFPFSHSLPSRALMLIPAKLAAYRPSTVHERRDLRYHSPAMRGNFNALRLRPTRCAHPHSKPRSVANSTPSHLSRVTEIVSTPPADATCSAPGSRPAVSDCGKRLTASTLDRSRRFSSLHELTGC
jgi:hypothetical protein